MIPQNKTRAKESMDRQAKEKDQSQTKRQTGGRNPDRHDSHNYVDNRNLRMDKYSSDLELLHDSNRLGGHQDPFSKMDINPKRMDFGKIEASMNNHMKEMRQHMNDMFKDPFGNSNKDAFGSKGMFGGDFDKEFKSMMEEGDRMLSNGVKKAQHSSQHVSGPNKEGQSTEVQGLKAMDGTKLHERRQGQHNDKSGQNKVGHERVVGGSGQKSVESRFGDDIESHVIQKGTNKDCRKIDDDWQWHAQRFNLQPWGSNRISDGREQHKPKDTNSRTRQDEQQRGAYLDDRAKGENEPVRRNNQGQGNGRRYNPDLMPTEPQVQIGQAHGVAHQHAVQPPHNQVNRNIVNNTAL